MQGTKKVKLTKPVIDEETEIPQKIWINFINSNNEAIGRSEIPLDAGPQQFQAILNQLLPEEDQQQYNFFYKTKEIKTKLLTFFKQISFQSFEETLDIIYHPVSQFKVKPVTRASSSMFGHTEAVLFIQFSPNSKHLASGSGDGSLRLWDINTQTPLKQIKCDDWVMIVQWSPDGEKIAYAQKNGNITIYTLETQEKIQLNGHSKFITSLTWQPLHLNQNLDTIISSSKDCTIRMWNALTGVCERSFGNHTKCVTKVVWTGSNQIISCSEDQKISVYDSKGVFLRGMRGHSHWVNTMSLSTQHVLKRGCFDPERKLIVGEHGSKKQVALKMYKESIKTHKQRLATGSDDFTIQLFELPQKKPIKQMTGHQLQVAHVQFSPDGRYIISGSFDKSIKLWDGYTGQFMCTFRGHVGPVYQIAWSADSRFLVSASKDSTLKLWDIKTRKLMKDLPGHADQIYALDWSSDGEKVATGGKDRQVKIWVN